MHPCDNLETLLRTLQAPRRNHYFYGKRMDVQHFQMEQDYVKQKQWLLNRLTFGKGVVCGLNVSVDGTLICVDPGFAIDGLGREIVAPVRTCIDALTQEGGCCTPCCGGQAATPAAPPSPGTPGSASAGASASLVASAGARNTGTPLTPPTGASTTGASTYTQGTRQIFTLWACYKECRTDYQPVLVSDCNTREQCAPGTTVESFCLKLTPGLPPLQVDPAWCAKLWGKAAPTQAQQDLGKAMDTLSLAAARESTSLSTGNMQPNAADMKAALASRRELLCGLFDGPCGDAEGDPCVPLAAVALLDQRVIGVESCLVRPRVYSNEFLLDLILCLAGRIDECCKGKQVTNLMRVKSVEFLGADSKVIASVQSPLVTTHVPINGQGNAIRVTFTQPFDQGAHLPTTPEMGEDNTWERHNFLVTPTGAGPGGLQYVPGTLTVTAPDTLLWKLEQKSQYYARGYKGWQKGKLQLSICGDPDTTKQRVAITDKSGTELDGEPIALAAGAISGNGSPGGTFTMIFEVY